jgi:putative endonuclease
MLKTLHKTNIRTYVGYTNNLKSRLTKHNSNKGAKATRGYQWEIIFKKRFLLKTDAMSYEYLLKKNRNSRAIILKRSINEK